MSITVLAHHHDPALFFDGANGEQLIIQTGTLVFEFLGVPDADWVRTRLVYPVFDLPDNVIFPQVRAIASAAPSSISYFPASVGVEGTGLVASGKVVSIGSADNNSGQAVVEGFAVLPVTGIDSATTSIPRGGWAVDRTGTAHSGNQVELVVDLAVLGPSSVFRLTYSLFVRILSLLNKTTTTQTNPKHVNP
jgi:hypothetical protein